MRRKIYRNDDWNDISVQGDLGIARLFDGGEAAGGIRFSQRWLGGERYSFGVGPWTRGRMRLSPETGVDLSLNADRREHPTRPDMDGWTVRLRSGLDYAFSARTSTRLEIDLENNDIREERHSHRIAGVAIALSHAFEGGSPFHPGLPFSSAATPAWFRCSRRSGLTDSSDCLSTLLHRRLQVRGFAPYVGYSYEVNRTNIPIKRIYQPRRRSRNFKEFLKSAAFSNANMSLKEGAFHPSFRRFPKYGSGGLICALCSQRVRMTPDRQKPGSDSAYGQNDPSPANFI